MNDGFNMVHALSFLLCFVLLSQSATSQQHQQQADWMCSDLIEPHDHKWCELHALYVSRRNVRVERDELSQRLKEALEQVEKLKSEKCELFEMLQTSANHNLELKNSVKILTQRLATYDLATCSVATKDDFLHNLIQEQMLKVEEELIAEIKKEANGSCTQQQQQQKQQRDLYDLLICSTFLFVLVAICYFIENASLKIRINSFPVSSLPPPSSSSSTSEDDNSDDHNNDNNNNNNNGDHLLPAMIEAKW